MEPLDKYLFQYIAAELKDATPDKIVGWYVTHLIFGNDCYFGKLQRKYALPNDLLKAHKKIVDMAKKGGGECLR